MFNDFFEKYPDYTIAGKPTPELIAKYEAVLPEQLIEFWKEYGFGSFMDGYIKIINPDEYMDVVFEAVDPSVGVAPIAITGLGDVWLWSDIVAIDMAILRYGKFNLLSGTGNLDMLFNWKLCDDSFIKSELKNKNYYAARKAQGDLAFDECFGYVPLLGLGGSEKASNLQKVKIREHIALIAQMMGRMD